MAASPTQLRENIDPGSIPQGQRQVLEQNLGALSAPPMAPAVAAPAAAGTLQLPRNPLDPLLGGDLPVNPEEVTTGLSVGPGAGPNQLDLPDAGVERLRMVANQARSPVLRELARQALRSSVRGRRAAG